MRRMRHGVSRQFDWRWLARNHEAVDFFTFGVDLTEGERFGRGIDDGKGVGEGHEACGEFLPIVRADVEFLRVLACATCTGSDVDDAFGPGVLCAVVGLVESPFAWDFLIFAEDEAGLGGKGKGEGALVVVNVSTQDEVHLVFFKKI